MLFLLTDWYLVVWQGNAQQRAAYHKNLKDCIKWYQKVEKEHLLEVERLQNLLNASEKKFVDTGN